MNSVKTLLGDRIGVMPVEADSLIAVPETCQRRGRYSFEADVVLLGNALTEEIPLRSRVLIEHRGEQEAVHDGMPILLCSTKAVLAVIERAQDSG